MREEGDANVFEREDNFNNSRFHAKIFVLIRNTIIGGRAAFKEEKDRSNGTNSR